MTLRSVMLCGPGLIASESSGPLLPRHVDLSADAAVCGAVEQEILANLSERERFLRLDTFFNRPASFDSP